MQQGYSQILSEIPAGIGATKVALRRFLKSIDQVGWSRHEESGRVDRRALFRYAAGAENIFSRRHRKEAEKSAVSILVDVSGSTAHKIHNDQTRRIEAFSNITIHLSKLLNECGAEVCINAFHGSRNMDEITRDIKEKVTFIEVKKFGESLIKIAPSIYGIRHMAAAATPDYSAMRLQIEELASRREHRKVLFVVTDAEHFNQLGITHLEKLAKKLGIVIVAIGCGGQDVSRIFTNAAQVNSAAELFTQSFNKLLHSLRA